MDTLINTFYFTQHSLQEMWIMYQALSAHFVSFRKNDILAIVGEDLKNLWKLFNTAQEVTKGTSFSNWQSEVTRKSETIQ